MKGDPLHTTHSASNICHQVASFLIMLVEEMAKFNILHAFKVDHSCIENTLYTLNTLVV